VPTTRGWLTVATALGIWGAGRVLGAEPLEQIGFALLALVVAAAVVVNSRGHELRVERELIPGRARRGQTVTVKLYVTNEGKRPAPLLLMDDQLPGELAAHARFAMNGIESNGSREAVYELRPSRRGRYSIGPLEVAFVDPFGLTQTRTAITEATELLVHPRVEKLALPRDRGQQRSMSVSALRQLSGARGEDFYTLRDYAVGDDLRKIHWPSTAKAGKTMIRQEETPWQNRATLIVDDRSAAHEGFGEASSFERCVEAAASIAAMYHSAGYHYRLAGAVDPGLPGGRGLDHFHHVLDLLAEINPEHVPASEDDPLMLRLAETEMGTSAEGTLSLVTGTLLPETAIALNRCRRRFRQVIAICYPGHRFGMRPTRARWDGEDVLREATTLLLRSGVTVLVLGPGDSLSSAWAAGTAGTARGGEAPWAQKPERV
jgi:uncharacterized protein (DUF58 family)